MFANIDRLVEPLLPSSAKRVDLFRRDSLVRNDKTACVLPTAHRSLFTASAAWTRQKSGTMSWLHAVQFLDEKHGWVAGSGGALLETTDGGATWNRVSTNTKETLRDVFFVDDHAGWLIAERDVYKLKSDTEARSYLLRTDDGGITWQPVYLDTTEANRRLVRVIFADPANGWVFGETGTVFVTRDGGAHWTRQLPPTRHLLLGGAFVDSSKGWLVGAGATIIHTSKVECRCGSFRRPVHQRIGGLGRRRQWDPAAHRQRRPSLVQRSNGDLACHNQAVSS